MVFYRCSSWNNWGTLHLIKKCPKCKHINKFNIGCTRCINCEKIRHRRRRNKNKLLGICSCGKTSRKGKFYCLDCVRYHNTETRKRNKLIKQRVIKEYGGACVCCKEKRIEFLSIDHIKGDGQKHRQLVGTGGGRSFGGKKMDILKRILGFFVLIVIVLGDFLDIVHIRKRKNLKKELELAISNIKKQHGAGSVFQLGSSDRMSVDAVTSGSLGLDIVLGVGDCKRTNI